MSEETRDRIVRAALETLRERGFAGTSARAIAQRGGVNQALLFYHFGSVNALLLAALDVTSEERLRRYREAFAGVRGLAATARTAAELYAEDRASGHITVLCELIAGSATAKELGPQIGARMQPWVRFTQDTLARAMARSPLRRLLPPDQLAYPIVATYLGVELLAHLDGDHARADALFATVERVAVGLGRTARRSASGTSPAGAAT